MTETETQQSDAETPEQEDDVMEASTFYPPGSDKIRGLVYDEGEDDEDAGMVTRDDIRNKICHYAGRSTRGATLGKEDLNSVYAFLTGEFLIAPARVFETRGPTGSDTVPEVDAVRADVLVQAYAVHGIDGLSSTMTSLDRPYNKKELCAILSAMAANGDERGWT